MAAASSSPSMLLAVPGCPTSKSPRSPASVTTHRSTSAREPTNFGSITIDLGASAGNSAEAGALIAAPRVPHRKSTTRSGESSQPGGRGAASTARRNASWSAYRSSAGGCWTDAWRPGGRSRGK